MPDETCLIEADREREKERLTYRDFQQRGNAVARALQDAAFRPDDRAAIIMTNQSKWLISAYAIFFSGGVLVPLDYKLTPDEQWQLLAHSGASVLVTEYPVWRQLAVAAGRSNAVNLKLVYVTEAPANADLDGAQRWEDTQTKTQAPVFAPRKRSDLATIVYSSGTGGRPKGCMMKHDNYLEQCVALTSLYPFAPGISLSQYFADESRDRFHGRILRPVHLRRDRRASANAAAGICARSVHEIQDHLRQPCAARAEEFAKGIAGAI